MRGRIDSDETVARQERHDWWGVVLECPDAPALARFYSDLLGWPIASETDIEAAIAPPGGVAYMAFQSAEGYVAPTWPSKADEQQMMMHLDFEVADLSAATQHAEELGAVVASTQPQTDVVVMLDPAGHPFCLYTDQQG